LPIKLRSADGSHHGRERDRRHRDRHRPRARPLNSYIRNLRISGERLIWFDATVEIPSMSHHEETAWSIVCAVAVAAGLVMALAITFA
jgi:hypothetical protein